MADKPRVGFYEFTGCAGDFLTLVHAEDYLVPALGAVELAAFRLASSRKQEGPLDIVFIEGSVTTTEHVEQLRELRARATTLVALGTCATLGGVQAMYTGADDYDRRFRSVYPESFSIVEPFASKPLSAVVKVDYAIPGCPIDPRLFLFNYMRLVQGLPVALPEFPVCPECKWRENECLLLKKIPCLGPITRAGCNARCPSHNLPCVGCFGPIEDHNAASWETTLLAAHFTEADLEKKIRIFFGSEAPAVLATLKQKRS